ncbi:S8 family peptidase [Pseudolysobacter antarcticus]|nr:S8 family serine peptidase [Pseudolysobacter antarcticus]
MRNLSAWVVLISITIGAFSMSAFAATPTTIVGAEVTATLAHADSVAVVVMLASPQQDKLIATNSETRRTIARSVDRVLAELPAHEFTLRRRFDNISAISLDISSRALAILRRDTAVLRIDVVAGGSAQLLQAAPLAHVSDVRALGFTGKNIKTAVIDSGVQLDHADLADSIVGQQCFCSSATPGVGCCPNGSATQSGAGSGADAEGHGTNVTGIITGNGSIAPQGGAPDANVVIVRVLDSHGSFYDASDIAAALDWIATNHPDTKIVNMSVGTNALFSSACGNAQSFTMVMQAAVNAVAANGTLMTASSGNQASATSISAPACINGVIAVGAVWDSTLSNQTFLGCTDTAIVADKPTCFTNSNALVQLYAPGAYTTATGLNTDPFTSNGQSSYGGTSQASPLVASCIADLFQLKPNATAVQIKAALAASPAHITDPKSGLSFPRLDCKQALIYLDRIFANGFAISP